MVRSMKEQKKPYSKPGIVLEHLLTGELTGTPEMLETIRAFGTDAVSCPAGHLDLSSAIRGGNGCLPQNL